MKEGLNKETLQRLYVDEGKTVTEIASIFNCTISTILQRARKFGIELRKPWEESVDIDKSTLRRLYSQEGKTVTEIASIFNCSVSAVLRRAKKFNLKPKYRRTRRIAIDKSTLYRLYVREKRTTGGIAKILGCSLSRVYKEAREIGL